MSVNAEQFSDNLLPNGGFEGISPTEKTEFALDRLSNDPDVMVLANVVYTSLSAPVQSRIMELVRGGKGLVITSPRKIPARFRLEPFPASREEILIGVSFDALPEFLPGLDRSRDERAAHGVNAYEVGKGRVVVIHWHPEEFPDGHGWEGIAPGAALLLKDAEVISDDSILVHYSRDSGHGSRAIEGLGATAELISEFVGQGGTVMADFLPLFSRFSRCVPRRRTGTF